MKPYDLGLFVGRFQHIHVGHEHVINTGFKLCDKILVLVGSAQESGTMRNPFDYAIRRELIKRIYADEYAEGRLIIKSINDLTNENDITPSWGKYVLKNVQEYMGKLPDVMVYGNDDSRSGWFDKEDIKDMMEVIVPRSRINISATKLRNLIIQGNFEVWQEYTNPAIHELFGELRDYLYETDYYKELIDYYDGVNGQLSIVHPKFHEVGEE
jgi:nicotinamide-nucleotide adenylyltransferase